MMPKSEYWIGAVVCALETEHKLLTKHGVSLVEVRQAVLFNAFISAKKHVHAQYGERLFVRGRTYDGIELFVVMKALDETDGVWEVKTARRIE